MDKIIEAFIWYVVFLFSTVCHEAAHAFTAWKLGDPTGYESGQVSLNPWPHIRREPLGTVLVPALSFLAAGWMLGWASTPYDPRWAYDRPNRAALMSLAGPATNLALVLAAAFGIRLGMVMGYFYAPESISFSSLVAANAGGLPAALATLLSVVFTLNLVLFVFNLMPLPPLDGSGALPLLLGEERARQWMLFVRNPMFTWLGLFAAWKLFGYVFHPMHLMAINLLYPGAGYH